MARILDLLQRTEERRTEPKLPVSPIGDDDPTADDNDDVPFIEVGAPGRVHLKPVRTAAPTIIPMPRPPHVEPREPVLTEDEPALFRITFQPLPFPGRVEGPPEKRFARELVAFHQPDHPISHQYRHLLNELEAQLGESDKTLLFAAALPGAGMTSVLLNLALACALRGDLRVAAVDANFDRSAMAMRLGTAAAPGLREVLARTVPLPWAMQETGQENLQLLPAGTLATEPDFTLWPLVLDQLRQRFDWVLIDGGICAARPEWSALAGTASATYLVLKQADLERSELNDALSDVPRHGGRLRGYILTRPNE